MAKKTFLTDEDEKRFVKKVNGQTPDENGNVEIEIPEGGTTGSGLTTAQINALDGMFKVCAFTKPDVSAEYNAFKTAFGIGGGEEPDVPDVPDVPDEPDAPEKTLTSISAVYSGGDVVVGTAVSTLTGIVVTAHYSDGTSETVTGYTLSGTIVEGSNTITVSYGGKTTIFAVTGVVDTSGEYTMLEYIETPEGQKDAVTSHTLAYINTNFIPTALTSAEYKIACDKYVPPSAHIGGVENWYLPVPRPTQSIIVKNRCGNEASQISFSPVAEQPYVFSAYMNGTDTIVVDGEILGAVPAGTNAPTGELPLFTYQTRNSNPFCGRLYYLKLYEDGALVHDYVPCKNAAGIVGLYDNVESVFLPHSGGAMFIAGPEV